MRISAGRRRRVLQLQQLVRAFLAERHAASPSTANEPWYEAAVASALPWATLWKHPQHTLQREYLLATTCGNTAAAFQLALQLAEHSPDDFADCRHPYLHEELLAVDDRTSRKQRGVYYTPPEIAQYIVRRVDAAIRNELQLSAGLAEQKLRLLDPAAGSGVFLAEVIQQQHRVLREAASSSAEFAQCWNEHVSQNLLPRLVGWETMPAAVVAGHCWLVATLAATGYSFRDAPPLLLEHRDALAPKEEERFAIVIGNPPYASLSTAQHGWIETLIRRDYTQLDGKPLGEKKHWLHDEYVKFLRLAQWQVEQCSQGVVGFVTNHGYLENASFRGMRNSLLQCFSNIEVIDLHGNAKLREVSPQKERDENVFGIAAGVAIGIFTRRSGSESAKNLPDQVQRGDLWGTRDSKLTRLAANEVILSPILPAAPHFRLAKSQPSPAPQFATAWRLCDAMPLNCTAPVTARDRFVVAFTREELLTRLAAFRDLERSDSEIRTRFFHRTRSSRYAPGDSRSWRLAEARQRLTNDNAWQERIRLCQYRPFDYRYVVWHEALIDWPRNEVMQHLLEQENVALIARRQSPRGAAANFVWATRTLALDGIIRSDNRGSESLFPLWRYSESGARIPNFAAEFWQEMERAAEYTHGGDELHPLAVAGYIYGLLWSDDYRADYAAYLCDDFPRIVLPRGRTEFIGLSERGSRLLNLHTQLPPQSEKGTGALLVEGEPCWKAGRIHLGEHDLGVQLLAAAWELRIGAHRPAVKWLKDRRGKTLTSADLAWYRCLTEMLEATARQEPWGLPPRPFVVPGASGR